MSMNKNVENLVTVMNKALEGTDLDELGQGVVQIALRDNNKKVIAAVVLIVSKDREWNTQFYEAVGMAVEDADD